MDGLGRELRQAARRLMRAPAFTAASVLTLALAIGANATIFMVVYRVLLNPLPYPESDRLIDLDHGSLALNIRTGMPMTAGFYHAYQDRARTLDSVAIYSTGEMTLTGTGDPERLQTAQSTPSLASVLQVQPALGRWFTEAEGRPGATPVVLLSHGLWTRRYGQDPSVLGRSVTLDGTPMPIVGVMPSSFAFPDPTIDAWVSLPLSPDIEFINFRYTGVARGREGTTATEIRAELNSLIADLPRVYPEIPNVDAVVNNARMNSTARTLKDATVGDVARGLWLLQGSVGLVLLIACANVANLLLVRSEAQRRDIALRRALGAGVRGLVRLFVAESALIAGTAGLLGLGLTWVAAGLLVRFGPTNLPRLDEVRVDEVTIVLTLALAGLATFGLAAIQFLRGVPASSALRESGRGAALGRGRHRARQLLMGGQVALALILLVSSGLILRSFQMLRAIDPGFEATSALTFRLGLPDREYPGRPAVVAAHHAILDQLSTLPGVTSASASTCLPLSGNCFASPLGVEGRPAPEGVPPMVSFRAVAGDYVEAMGMRLRRGRAIDRRDVESGEPIVLVNEALVRAYFPNQDPIGVRVRRGTGAIELPWLTVVGIVSDTPSAALAEPDAVPQLYMPMSASGLPDGYAPGRPTAGPPVVAMSYVVRSATPPLDLMTSVRRAVADVDPNLALAQVRTLQDMLDDASAQMAFTMVLLVLAATVALVLGVVGIYGVMSYVVTQRTGEIGVRLALGAAPGRVAGAVVRQGALVALAGAVVGLVAALAGGPVLESLLYGIGPRDPGVFVATTLLLLVVVLCACWIPARRASRLSPLDALRAE